MQDTIELTLPVSGKVVILRNYTTRADDERAEAVLYAGVKASAGADSSPKINFPVANMMASQASYIPRLVKTIDGESANILSQLQELRSEDYTAIEEAVSKITEEHSPKAKAASDNSETATKRK